MKVKLMTSLFLMTAMMTSVHAFEFARDGKASCVLVHSDRMAGLDKQAVDELKTYLEKMTGAEFTVLPESGKKNGPAIYLGNTRAAAEQGIDAAVFQDEEWQILDKGNELYLTGGQPAGTYYAVRSLLEKAGCWSLTPDQEIVPNRPSLAMNQLNERKKPAIAGRNFYDGLPWMMTYTKVSKEQVNAYWLHRLRNRYNGGHGIGRKEIQDAFYLSRHFKLTQQVPGYHTMSYYVDPTLYEKHPEYFAMDEHGKRVRPKILFDKTAVNTTYCYTNRDVKRIALENMLKTIAKDRETGTSADWPVVYDFSALDSYSKVCLCPECRKLVKEKGSNADLLLDLVNYLADNVRKKYPDVIIRTFAAYNGVKYPPVSTKAAPNVLWQYCDSFSRSDCFRPLTHSINQELLAQLKSWLNSGGRMSLWDYGNIGDRYFYPPRIETVIDSFKDDLRLFRDNNVLAVFYECETSEVLVQNFAEMTKFLYAQLALDPEKDMEQLIEIFMNGYYGPADPMLREYLETIRKGVRDCKQHQLTNRVANWPHMSLRFMMESYQKFKEAEKLTEPGSVYRKRLHYEMIPLLYLMIQNSDDYKAALDKIGTSEKQLMAEYKLYTEEFITRLNGADMTRPRKTVDDTIKILSLKYPIPQKFKSISPELVRVVGPSKFRQFKHIGSAIVEDPQSLYGQAIKASGLNKDWHGVGKKIAATKTIHVAPAFFKFGNTSMNITQIPQDEKYHWYKFPKSEVLNSASYLWGQGWAIQVELAHLFVLGDGSREINLWDCWVSLKFTGPEWVKGSTKDNAIYLDSVVLLRPEQKK